MAWRGIVGQDHVVEQFRRALARGRLASTFLFVGPDGCGKRTFALQLAQVLLCQTRPAAELAPCDKCDACRQVIAGSHPDLLRVEKPKDKSTIPVKAFIGEDERRMREGLCHDIALRPFMGGRKVAIIDDADFLNEEGANCLLKTLEEPPPRSVLILLGTSVEKQLPTIRSRCQVIRFAPLPTEAAAELLLSQGIAADADEARWLAANCGGGLTKATELADRELWEFRGKLLAWLAGGAEKSVAFAAEVNSFVDAAGKEAPPRRARARQLVGFAAEFYRHVLRGLNGAVLPDDQELARAVRQALPNWTGHEDAAAAGAERCLETLAHIDRNANQATYLDCWIDDLAQV